MADTTIGVRLEADDQVSPKVRNIKSELKAAQAEVIAMTEKFGAMSKEAANAAAKAAELKNTIDDSRKLVDAFNPDTKFRAFGASIQTVVGGFTALTGVMGLVGVKSKEVEGLLLKVQSALALSQGVAQLQEGIKSFKNLSAVIQQTTLFQKLNNAATTAAAVVMRIFGVSVNTTSLSFKVLKGAIIATGIGALIVLLGVVADAMNLFGGSTDDAAKSQEALRKVVDETNEALGRQQSTLKRQEDLEIARAKQRGASEREIFELKQLYRRLDFDATLTAYDGLAAIDKKAAQDKLDRLKDINTEGQVAQIEFDIKEKERLKAEREKANAESEKAFKERLDRARKERAEELRIKAAGITGKVGAGLGAEIAKTPEQLQFEAEVKARHDLRLQEEADLERHTAFKAANTQFQIDLIQEQIDIEEQQYENKVAIASATANLLGGIADLIGRQTAAGKVLAIAQATINTFLGATEVLRAKSILPEPAGSIVKIASVAAIIASGISAIKNIIKTPVPGAGGGSVPALAVATAPLTPQRPQNQTTQLDQNSLNAIGNATTHAFVLEADVTNNQERVRRLNRAARL